jgi:hypothetical protein
VLAAGFLFVGLWPVVLTAQKMRVLPVALSLFFAAAGILVPRSLRPFRSIWIAFGELLGRVNSKIILGTVYYLMLTPVRLVMKAAGHDPMHRDFNRDCDSYRVVRQARPASHMKNQF